MALPWKEKDRGSGILEPRQRRALLSDEEFSGETGRKKRKRIRKRIRNSLYDIVLIDRELSDRDFFKVLAPDSDALTNPSDETAVRLFRKSALGAEDVASDPMEMEALFGLLSFWKIVIKALGYPLDEPTSNSQDHPLVRYGNIESEFQAELLVILAIQASWILLMELENDSFEVQNPSKMEFLDLHTFLANTPEYFREAFFEGLDIEDEELPNGVDPEDLQLWVLIQMGSLKAASNT